MCGIAGVLDGDTERAVRRVGELNARQRHRGPDHAALARAGSFTLGNTRLAIQDPTPAGNQPFRSTDGRYVCVFNGEIYNHLELADEHRLDLPNRCDGAVIPELWARLGPACLPRLRGMYAMALVDTAQDRLYLCRDPFGIKPLYYRRLPDATLAFASEVKPLAMLHSLPPVARDALASYLHLGAVPADASPFEGVEALPPNTRVTVDARGGVEQAPILAGPHPLLAGGDGAGPARALLESVRLHLRSDVPTVLLLSGGADSAAVAAAARRLGHDLACMTVAGLGDHDESGDAAATAAHYGHAHQVVPACVDDQEVAAFFRAMQRPTIDGLNTFVVCRAVQQAGYRVALSGLGGDEALGGYSHYRVLPWLRVLAVTDRAPAVGRLLLGALRRVPAGGARLGPSTGSDKLARLLSPGGPRTPWDLDVLQREVHPPSAVAAMTGAAPPARPAPAPGPAHRSGSFSALVEAEVANYLQPTLLPDSDAFSMCSSVELRVPLVDQPFFAAAAAAARPSGRAGKRRLADALGDAYLASLTARPKRGFSVPMQQWLTDGPLQPLAHELTDPHAPVWDVVSRDAAVAHVAARPPRRWSPLWSLVALNRWLSSLEPGPADKAFCGSHA